MSIKTKFEKINLDKLKSDSPQAYNILNGWATSTKNFSDDKANEVVEPLFNKLYDKLVSGKFWYVIEGNKQPSDQVAEPITKKEEVAIVKEVIKSEPTPKKKDEPKTKSVKAKATKTHTASTKPKHTPTPPKMDGKSVFEIAKELRAKDSTLTQKEAVKKAGQMVKDAHRKVKDDELQALMKMIKSDPAYSVLKPEKNTSIIRDLGRPAIRTTKRVSKKGWKNQYGASEGGRTYYENRVNRMDVNKTPMYANGGMMADGGELNSMSDEKIARIYANMKDLDYSDVIIEIKGNRAERRDAINEILRETAKSGNSNEMEDGGMMAKGGELANVVVYDNGGESFDRYTIFTPDGSVYGMSENASGFNMYIGDDTEIEKGSHLGKKLKSVPEGIKKAVLDRMSETFAKGGSVGKNYYESFNVGKSKYVVHFHDGEKTHNDGSPFYDIEIFSNKIAKDKFINNLLENGYSRKYAKGGRTYKSFVGRTSKETWGKENLYSKYDNNLDLIADVSDYFKELESDISKSYADEQKDSLIEVLKTGKLKFNDGAFLQFAKGGSVGTILVAYANMDYDSKIGEFDSLDSAKKFAKANKSKYETIMFEDSFGDNFIVSEDDSDKEIDYLFTMSYAKGGSVHGKHLPTSDVEYARKLKIDKLVIDGKEVSEDDIVSGVFFKKFAKGGGIDNSEVEELKRNINSLKQQIEADYRTKQIDNYTIRNEKELDRLTDKLEFLMYGRDSFAKGGKVGKFDAYEVEEKLADLSNKVWDDLKRKGSLIRFSEIYESDAVQKKMVSAYKKAGIDKMFLEYNAKQRKEIAEALTDENQHSLRNYLALRGYLGEDEKHTYVRMANEYNVGKRKIVLNPSNIPNTPSNSSATSPKAGSKAGYFYVPKSDILSIDYTKDGESHTAKNTDILDGAYIKISALKYASGGRLPKDEVVYVPKAEIEEIKVSDSGFKVKDVTEELLSGIHLKASALSPKSEPKKPSGTFGTTRVYKGYNGWVGRTSAYNFDGKDYEITTMKRSNGKLWSNAQEGKFENGMFTYMVFQSPNINLIETKPSKVTEKAVSEQHDKAIAKFKEMKGL